MDVNFLGLIGSLIRLSFVYKFNFNKQREASNQNFEKEEKRDVLIGLIAVIIFLTCGVLAYVVNW
ncbi:hypothetical protein [Chryseobacterium turcicum]|uniref:Uncharacterized protein n=1 Tax=Chryseobacterium turcicum TaxID=2898076 RepID=A0A9Q3V0M1_9FLAO|nr:hypothetical protein [Chryseobacterium turcicum]MCD1116679.1 hypothetical protein [Chryseobacterium turcicum]